MGLSSQVIGILLGFRSVAEYFERNRMSEFVPETLSTKRSPHFSDAPKISAQTNESFLEIVGAQETPMFYPTHKNPAFLST